MDRLRLDPSDPLGSVLAWLAALADALGIDLAKIRLKVRLDRAGAAWVRRQIADWRRQLKALVLARAVQRAASLRLTSPLRRRSAPPPAPHSQGDRICRGAGDQTRGIAFGRPMRSPCPHGGKDDASAFISDAEDAALRRRSRAVLAALEDPSEAIARLARRLARRRALRAERLAASRRGRRRFPHPPRVTGDAARLCVLAPEPRPPDRLASVQR